MQPKLNQITKNNSQSLSNESENIQSNLKKINEKMLFFVKINYLEIDKPKKLKNGLSIDLETKSSNKKDNILNKEIKKNIKEKNMSLNDHNVNAVICTKITPINQKQIPKKSNQQNSEMITKI